MSIYLYIYIYIHTHIYMILFSAWVPSQKCCSSITLYIYKTSSKFWQLQILLCLVEDCTCLDTIIHYTQRRIWQPTPVLLPGESQGQGDLVGCSAWGHGESDTTEWLHTHTYIIHALQQNPCAELMLYRYFNGGWQTRGPGSVTPICLHITYMPGVTQAVKSPVPWSDDSLTSQHWCLTICREYCLGRSLAFWCPEFYWNFIP